MKTFNALTEGITNHALFRGMKPEHLAVLLDGAKPLQFRVGDLVFQEREPASKFYLIEEGKIALEAHEPADGTMLIHNLGPGEALGWSWLFPPFSWHFQARAIEPTRLVVLNGAHLLATAERDPEFGYELMKRVAQIVIHRLQTTRERLVGFEVESALKG